MKYRLLQELLPQLEAFEKLYPNGSPSEFGRWLSHRAVSQQKADEKAGAHLPHVGHLDNQLTYGISTLYQHARHYLRKALKSTSLHNAHDFAFLASLQQDGDQRKSDLIHRNFLEQPSGIEVIKRLIRKGQAEDYPDPDDGRSRRVRITQAGMRALGEAAQQLGMVGQIVGGNLDEGEKQRLLDSMHKLMRFHQRIWDEDQGKALTQIIERHSSSDQ